VTRLGNKISIRKGAGLHDRFILTRGKGWSIGHSLKDLDQRIAILPKW
jgi:hypothetical protein